MKLSAETLELTFEDYDFGLSARRLWEHTELGQINVFSQTIRARQASNDPESFVDVVRFDGDTFSLAGLTLADLRADRFPANQQFEGIAEFLGLTHSKAGVGFVSAVASHLDLCSIRQATRNQHQQFLPPAADDDVFGVPHVFSTLRHRLQSMGKAIAESGQWLKTIGNFQKKGLRTEEFDCSNLLPELAALDDEGKKISAVELADLCDFKELRLSVVPVVDVAQRQLSFTKPPSRKLLRTRNLPKALMGLPREVARFDPVLGYRLEQVEHQTLWGAERNWQAVTYRGKVIRSPNKRSVFQTETAAAAMAASHARLHYPKRVALGHFGAFAWNGGESYREWLITLPYHPAYYLGDHFEVRNVLAHVRCDVRQGALGEQILMLQEVQSDWAQSARRAISQGELDAEDAQRPPFMKEWSALAMKLMLLHAAHQGLDGVAWTRGNHQVSRYGGLGATGLRELYDRTLPSEVNRIMKPSGVQCETLGVYVPANFRITQTELGYEVYSPANDLLGTAQTLEDAEQFKPDGAHELLYEVHGVRLPQSTRKAILHCGFPAWG
jgi:hypothetical protein